MSNNKNQLREDALEFAVLVADICDSLDEKGYYTEQLIRASATIGTCLMSIKNLREDVSIIRRLNVALDACTELMFAAKVLYAQNKLDELSFKNIKKQASSLERRILATISE